MLKPGGFERVFEEIKHEYQLGSVEYTDPAGTLSSCISAHFAARQAGPYYGVYVVRQQGSKSVLYIGKGGTVRTNGTFKNQDLPGRIRNTKEGSKNANEWFREILDVYGPIIIEYIVLPVRTCPAFVEAYLLQAFLNDYGNLPPKNKSF